MYFDFKIIASMTIFSYSRTSNSSSRGKFHYFSSFPQVITLLISTKASPMIDRCIADSIALVTTSPKGPLYLGASLKVLTDEHSFQK